MKKDISGFPVKISTQSDGTYWGEVLILPGCFSRGDTLAELETNLQEAILCHLESIVKDQASVKLNIVNKKPSYVS